MQYSYLSPKLQAVQDPQKGGGKVIARYFVNQGELIAAWGGGVVETHEFNKLPRDWQVHSIQIEENLYLVPNGEVEPADLINHSCDPNTGLSGQIVLVAMRDIQPREEITFDYAMSDGSPYDEFDCACGAQHCRGRVTGEDWRLPMLWQRYAGYFSPYLQRRIDALRKAIRVDVEEGF